MGEDLTEVFGHAKLTQAEVVGATSPEDLFSILETFEDAINVELPPAGSQELAGPFEADEDDEEAGQARKKQKVSDAAVAQDGQQKMSHITVERNRRKQMNDHLSVLRSLMPCFYVKRGDQASIIGGVVEYIKELQQVLQSLEAKKQRKAFGEVLSPRPASSPRPCSTLSPRPPPLSPRMALPISPKTPQPRSPYGPRMQRSYLSPTLVSSHESSSPSLDSSSSELVANSKSPVPDVEVKFSGPNVILRTVSHRIPGQALKIVAALEALALEILRVSITTADDTMLNSFTIKVHLSCSTKPCSSSSTHTSPELALAQGDASLLYYFFHFRYFSYIDVYIIDDYFSPQIGIECELSAEELAQNIQQTFC
ncbi:hypothetical protein B296_00006886 [Ensete ventricosum]|uniref:BHLH domain-containing protein n=1 Tax=Ensete ventricosum TaxID=4639 RepID=A0A427B957_ENSVE|nr:hypothetical protein B296_00006886 [Ensete ventricosum]